jgi:L-arabinokinase
VTPLVFYISGHGFGHASRDIEVLNALSARRPDLHLIVRSEVPEWLLRSSAEAEFELQRAQVDSGVAQVDSLTIDEAETARRAEAFYADFERRSEEEAWLLRDLDAGIVVGDIPALAFAAAARAGVPSVALGNFTWDWIYAGFAGFDTLAPQARSAIRSAYERTGLTLRLPMHGGFAGMRTVVDVPHIARHAARSREETRRLLDLDPGEVVVLASFGGYGLPLDYETIAAANQLTVVVTDHETDKAGTRRGSGGLRRVSRQELAEKTLRYEDLVGMSDVVVTKPGYGIVSECIANDVALLYTSRGAFPEYDVMVAEMPRVLRCRHIEQEDLLAGRWAQSIRALLSQALPRERAATNGAEIVADAILGLL